MRSALALLFLLPTFSLANGGGYITGVKHTGAFQPIGIDQVEMLSERLEIDLHIEYTDIRIEYVLHNPGKKVKVEAGFPSAIWSGRWFESDADWKKKPKPSLNGFSLSADGKNLQAEKRDDELVLQGFFGSRCVTSWHVFKLAFNEGQTRKLSVRYRTPYEFNFSSVSEDASIGALRTTYLFSAAGAWAGPIRSGTVIVRCMGAKAENVVFSHPKRFEKRGENWVWEFSDFEPTLEDDLVITTRPAHMLLEAGADLIVGSGPHIVQRLDHLRGGSVAFSLGNTVFDGPGPDADWSRGALLEVTLEAAKTPLRLLRARLLPTSCTTDGVVKME